MSAGVWSNMVVKNIRSAMARPGKAKKTRRRGRGRRSKGRKRFSWGSTVITLFSSVEAAPHDVIILDKPYFPGKGIRDIGADE
jgi:hypothetical protein